MTCPPMYDDVLNPLRDALQAITGVEPPAYTLGAWSAQDLNEEDVVGLQDWCSENARPEWSTGLGVFEAAELMVKLAVENANIGPRPGKKAKC